MPETDSTVPSPVMTPNAIERCAGRGGFWSRNHGEPSALTWTVRSAVEGALLDLERLGTVIGTRHVDLEGVPGVDLAPRVDGHDRRNRGARLEIQARTAGGRSCAG